MRNVEKFSDEINNIYGTDYSADKPKFIYNLRSIVLPPGYEKKRDKTKTRISQEEIEKIDSIGI